MVTLRISIDRARVGRGKAWIERSGIVERGEDAWDWLRHDERGRIVGLVVASVAMSIAMSIVATVAVRALGSRRAAGAAAGEPVGEADAHVEAEAVLDAGAGADPAVELPIAAAAD